MSSNVYWVKECFFSVDDVTEQVFMSPNSNDWTRGHMPVKPTDAQGNLVPQQVPSAYRVLKNYSDVLARELQLFRKSAVEDGDWEATINEFRMLQVKYKGNVQATLDVGVQAILHLIVKKNKCIVVYKARGDIHNSTVRVTK